MKDRNKTVLVTGVNGFVGPHLARELLSRDCTVIGVGYGQDTTGLAGDDQYRFISCDLTEEVAVQKIDLTNTDTIIHLAGLASPAASFAQPRRYIADNSAMLINLLETILGKYQSSKSLRFINISSGAVYRNDQEMPLKETSGLSDGSPYVVGKVLNENLCGYYRKRGIECITVRPFNHTGPGQSSGFIIPDLVAQALNTGPGRTIEVGDLKTRRDYSDVRDIVRGYADIALANKLSHDTYNLCAGRSYSGEEIVKQISALLFGDEDSIKTKVLASKIRPNDPFEIYGSNDRVKKELGWQPTIPLEQTIRDYVAWIKPAHIAAED